MNELKKRLEAYYVDRDITDITLKEAISRCIGSISWGTYDEIYADIDHETDSFTYDVNFECILDQFADLFYADNAAQLFSNLCGYYGQFTLLLDDSLGMYCVESGGAL